MRKSFSFLAVLLALLFGSLTLAACGSDNPTDRDTTACNRYRELDELMDTGFTTAYWLKQPALYQCTGNDPAADAVTLADSAQQTGITDPASCNAVANGTGSSTDTATCITQWIAFGRYAVTQPQACLQVIDTAAQGDTISSVYQVQLQECRQAQAAGALSAADAYAETKNAGPGFGGTAALVGIILVVAVLGLVGWLFGGGYTPDDMAKGK